MANDPQQEVIDVEYELVAPPPRPKPWWRRIYLKPGWWIPALLSAAAVAQRFAHHQ